jgi:dethiobiotin synthetase
MTGALIVTGTDTNVGKTVFAAGLTGFLNGVYWKPIQSGLDGETDSQIVARLIEAPDRVWAERYRLRTPASPHLAAELDGINIEPGFLTVPTTDRTLIIEGAGGLLVPLNRETLFIDVFAQWQLPIILCARTGLGTINHTLLSIEALRRRNLPLLGVAFIGDIHEENERIIASLGRVRVLGRLPLLDSLSPATLRTAFAQNFSRQAFFPGAIS